MRGRTRKRKEIQNIMKIGALTWREPEELKWSERATKVNLFSDTKISSFLLPLSLSPLPSSSSSEILINSWTQNILSTCIPFPPIFHSLDCTSERNEQECSSAYWNPPHSVKALFTKGNCAPLFHEPTYSGRKRERERERQVWSIQREFKLNEKRDGK